MNAIRKTSKLHFGVYHSLFEWFNPLYMEDAKNNYTTQNFVVVRHSDEIIFFMSSINYQFHNHMYKIINALHLNKKKKIFWCDICNVCIIFF